MILNVEKSMQNLRLKTLLSASIIFLITLVKISPLKPSIRFIITSNMKKSYFSLSCNRFVIWKLQVDSKIFSNVLFPPKVFENVQLDLINIYSLFDITFLGTFCWICHFICYFYKIHIPVTLANEERSTVLKFVN